MYHGFYYSTMNGREHGVTPADIAAYEKAVGKKTAWVFFSDFWFEGRRFPTERCRWVSKLGKVPYIRLMLRSSDLQERPDPPYALKNILAGKFDADLRRWARGAKAFGSPLLVEWGTECNGWWFPWNGKWNGAGRLDGFGDPKKPDGPERFVAAFRHIVELMRAEGAENITWVWHPDSEDNPETSWNRLENYYPGDAYVDWIGLSCYGPLSPIDRWGESFSPKLDPAYRRLTVLAPSKPVIVSEFGCALRHYRFRADRWAEAALTDLFKPRWPRIIGFCWWNETWENDDNPRHNTDMVIWHDAKLSNVFRTQLERNRAKLQESPVIAAGG
jgi:hypothetical protein